MEKVWAEVSCEVPESMVDILAAYLAALSSCGVSIENLNLDTFSLDTLIESPVKTVKAYFQLNDSFPENLAAISQYLRQHGPSFPAFEFKNPQVKEIREENWANDWKKYFKPARIGSRVIIKPTWEEFSAAPADIILQIDPGMAFGTGTHPTTRLCLEALEQIAFNEGLYAALPRDMTRVLDVGTGSGILSIGAVKFGAETVIAIDIDSDAVDVARQNFVLNDVISQVSVSTTPLAAVPGTFQVVVANILAEELVRLAPELLRRLAGSGFLILSGILLEKEGLVLEGFAPFGLKLVEIRRYEEWSCLVYYKEP